MAARFGPVPDIPGAPPGLLAVLRRAMAYDPANRPVGAAAFRDELAAADLSGGAAIPVIPAGGGFDPPTPPANSTPGTRPPAGPAPSPPASGPGAATPAGGYGPPGVPVPAAGGRARRRHPARPVRRARCGEWQGQAASPGHYAPQAAGGWQAPPGERRGAGRGGGPWAVVRGRGAAEGARLPPGGQETVRPRTCGTPPPVPVPAPVD